jgi:hypothetical protein
MCDGGVRRVLVRGRWLPLLPLHLLIWWSYSQNQLSGLTLDVLQEKHKLTFVFIIIYNNLIKTGVFKAKYLVTIAGERI